MLAATKVASRQDCGLIGAPRMWARIYPGAEGRRLVERWCGRYKSRWHAIAGKDHGKYMRLYINSVSRLKLSRVVGADDSEVLELGYSCVLAVSQVNVRPRAPQNDNETSQSRSESCYETLSRHRLCMRLALHAVINRLRKRSALAMRPTMRLL